MNMNKIKVMLWNFIKPRLIYVLIPIVFMVLLIVVLWILGSSFDISKGWNIER